MTDAPPPSPDLEQTTPGSGPPAGSSVEPLLEQTIEVAAPAQRVWELVSDLPRMAAWSPQVVRTLLPGGRPVRLGSTMVNLNRRGMLVWPTTARVVRFDPGAEVAFRVRENGTTWSFALEPTSDGTRIVQRREAPHGTTRISKVLVRRVLGGQARFTDELRAGMHETLERIRAEAEG